MANVKQVELKPCPFCGGEQLEICRTDYTPDNCKAYAVTCRTRDCHGAIFALGYGLFDTEAEAITAWNTRSAEQGKAELVEAAVVLRERLLALVGAVADITNCRADVDAIIRFDAALQKARTP